MNCIAVAFSVEMEFWSKVWQMVFPFSIAVGVSAIILYLWKLVLVSTELFQAFWSSLEDED
jgi:hypothetical protein